MDKYLQNNIGTFNEFCTKNNISSKKVLEMPRCYSSNEMYIQTYEEKKSANGLKGNRPADVLLIIRKSGDNLEFELTEKGKEELKV